MKDLLGTISMGVRAPIIREGDDLASIVATSILEASELHNIPVEDKDIVAVTESVVARSEGNYVTVDDVAYDIEQKFGKDAQIAVLFPIMSRNRFAMCLKGIARAARKLMIVFKYPSDEVGNKLISDEDFDKIGGNDSSKTMSEKTYRSLYGYKVHEFTGVDYVDYYRKLIESENCEAEISFSNNASDMVTLDGYDFLCSDIHTREATKKTLKEYGATVYGLDEICTTPRYEGCGYNPSYGLLGSNKANEERLKLFPRTGDKLVERVQILIKEATGKHIEVMVYGDGAFKDPVGKIWELADPVVSPAYTSGLAGRPNELKLKALADGKYANLSGEELKKAITEEINHKGKNLVGDMSSQGTTPRQITDLVGSLADLTSGSGDKGTPIVWIKGYFKNYAND